MPIRNSIGTDGLDFLEFCTLEPRKLSAQFESMGFHPVAVHQSHPVTIYQQNDIRFIINETPDSQAFQHAKRHGTSICSMGFKVRDADTALQYVRLKGGTPYQPLDEKLVYDMPCIYGVGNMLIYFVEYQNKKSNYRNQFSDVSKILPASQQLSSLDHLTFNLYRGHMIKWADYFSKLFNFHEIPHSSSEKKSPTTKSKSMVSACGKIRMSLSESSSEKSPVETFLNHYNGEGIKHVEFKTNDKLSSPVFLSILDTIEQKNDEGVIA